MTGIKKKEVLETVSEAKADELSAMYNMLLDEKRRVAGEHVSEINLVHPKITISYLIIRLIIRIILEFWG